MTLHVTIERKKHAVKTWSQRHPWTLTYIATIATLNVILQLVLR